MESRFDSVLDDRATLSNLLPSEINEDDARERSNSKTKFQKEASNSTIHSLNKVTAHIRKPPRRKGSPINWFPRRKMDSYLKRKIKMLQELGGLNSTLDETLGDSNPHYSRVLKEKIAVREAAKRAMEARKAALVEASWCRILRAARIQNKEAEAQLLRAEEAAADAFEAAAEIGVIMHDLPCWSEKLNEIETSSLGVGGSITHTVKTSFETAFEVEKEVAAAVKAALIRLSNCSSFNEEEFKEIPQKISQKPDITVENNTDSSAILSECESESCSELETDRQNDSLLGVHGLESKIPVLMRSRKGRRNSFEKLNMEKLVGIMLEKLKCLQGAEISSLATIVATYGLNAALNELENDKPHDTSGQARSSQVRKKQVETELPSLDKFLVKHLTKLEREIQEAKKDRRNESKKATEENANANWAAKADAIDKPEPNAKNNFINCKKRINITPSEVDPTENVRAKEVADVPSLDKVLVKHVSRLEREVQDAKNRRTNKENVYFASHREIEDKENIAKSSQHIQKKTPPSVEDSLDKILVKPVHWWEREKRKALTAENVNQSNRYEKKQENNPADCESLDKVLVKHVSRLEKEKIKLRSEEEGKIAKKGEKNTNEEEGLDRILLKHKSKLEKEKMAAAQQHYSSHSVTVSRRDVREKELQEAWGGLSLGNYIKHENDPADCESLDKVLVKHVSRLEKEKIKLRSEEEGKIAKKGEKNTNEEEGLDRILLKHKSKLEKEKMAAAQQHYSSHSVTVSRRDVREKELQEAWGGLSLGNSIKPHLSRLEREKAAWKKAEEEERRQSHE